MDLREQNVQDRVREHNPEEENNMVDQKLVDNLQKFTGPSQTIIANRLQELKEEWDVERHLQVNAASIGLFGLLMGTVFKKKWFFLSGIVSGLLLQHGIQGRGASVNLFRAFGVRTKQEIAEEIYALKVIRGDFDYINADSDASEILEALRK